MVTVGEISSGCRTVSSRLRRSRMLDSTLPDRGTNHRQVPLFTILSHSQTLPAGYLSRSVA
jgi:hypothetical protein